MTNEQKRNTIEENYINDNISDAKMLIKKMSLTDRKDFAIDAMYRTYAMEVSNHRNNQYGFAKFIIENL